ncbi:hypothetical protein BDY19DRAFT_748944 [Irpex rosettiformis]|uniref:Uncharacterized protein n=1 Tax=Irpex rosettiformis TaxID=378272 RepID=A0ACB8U6Z7_9APHY|nr:hypothetical protein BDY19DRAFT_748944 [Irpex rosettiformis]
MDNCPAEVLLNIFSYVCTDTGQAGCTLSLVSRRFHDVSSLIRFEKICLKSLLRMRFFHEMLKRRSSPPVVRHLFLRVDSYDSLLPHHYGDDEDQGSDLTPADLCVSIVSSLAPFLITLAGCIRNLSLTHGSLFRSVASFPLLRDLNLSCSVGDEANISLPSMPSLRRFHMINPNPGKKFIVDLNFIIEHAPQLTHIRLSNFFPSCTLRRTAESALKRETSSQLCLPQGLEVLKFERTFACRFKRDDPKQFEITDGPHTDRPLNRYNVRDCEEDWKDVTDQAGEGCWRIRLHRTLAIREYLKNLERMDGVGVPLR